MGKIINLIKMAILLRLRMKATKTALSLGDTLINKKAGTVFTSLRPIAGLFWLLHPRKAVYFFVLQKSIALAWSIVKAIVTKKI